MHFQQRVDRQIQRMLEKNVIELSESNFINPLVAGKKKNDDLRLCLNMHNLNSVSQKNFDCAPTADSLF